MILILSQENDFTTNLVQDWLYYYNKRHIRINNYFDSYYFKNENIFLSSKQKEDETEVNLKDFTSYWYRRGKLLKDIYNQNPVLKGDNSILEEYISFFLKSKKGVGNFMKNDVNKLLVLEIAKNVGLKVPSTYIIESKNELLKLLNSNVNKEFITKMITGSSTIQFDDTTCIAYTNLLSEHEVKKFPEFFSPSLIQEKINKTFEIRTFYLKGKSWSMAIFSQKDEQTKVDYRRYNNIKPNRNTPFKLPDEVEKKLCSLMDILELDTGSIDWIYSTENEYFFLEVNPVGQFNNVSVACNYNLEKKIAEEL